jgi:hypothetical protein
VARRRYSRVDASPIRPLLEAVEQIGDDRVFFSVDYRYEQMTAAGRWFDESLVSNGQSKSPPRKRGCSAQTRPQSTRAEFGYRIWVIGRSAYEFCRYLVGRGQ